MWQLHAELKVSYRPDYNGIDSAPPSTLPLDKVEVAGCLKLDEVFSTTSLKCAAVAKRLLQGEGINFKMKTQDHIPTVATRWKSHIIDLEKWGILERDVTNHTQRHRWICGYFAVAKNENVARAILNARELSKMCDRPPLLNLLEVQDMLRLAQRYVGHLFQCDFRHWFHQFKLSGDMRRFFNVIHDGSLFCWVTLPMGWSFSPYICQVVSWALILHVEPGDQLLFSQEEIESYGDHPPRELHLITREGQRVGFVSVLYDNLGAWSISEPVIIEFRNHFERNCRMFNAKIKDGSMVYTPPKQLKMREDDERNSTYPVHVGVQFSSIKINRIVHLCWRVDKKTIDRWRTADTPTKGTPREFAQWAGRVLWSHRLRCEPLLNAKAAIEVLRTCATNVKGDGTRWGGTTMELPMLLHSDIVEAWQKVLANEWISKNREADGPVLHLFTDASDTGWGCVLANHVGHLIFSIRRTWTSTTLRWHIFLKEMAAALWSMILTDDRSACIVVSIDNSATLAAIKRGFSSNTIANDLLAHFYQRTAEWKTQWSYARITSAKNPADEPSRGSVVISEKLRNAVVDLEKCATTTAPPAANSEGLRHNVDETNDEYIEELDAFFDSVITHHDLDINRPKVE